MPSITVTQLNGVVYSAGKVFDGLSASRLATEKFLRLGRTDGIDSRADLALLKDLRDAAHVLLDHHGYPDATFVCAINASLTRSAALHPGQFRTADQQIGVSTRHGRHTPGPITDQALQALLDNALDSPDVHKAAVNVFVDLARAQPFEDGNKRTALLAANTVLLAASTGTLLAIPFDDNDPSVTEQFNDRLATAYIQADCSGVTAMLLSDGIIPLPPATRPRIANL
ncbi:Fic family protein [Gordonia sp. i37]|uniref:Fic family protein n=1 Tax=Gordonia sp. i37 TaxID=1961707 RepID=UPI0009AEBD30|nr:Fic family protein [Gordonia sp. i37]OPX16006.1 cell filamentation protein Fic [Gordonia sp. i37]